MMRILMALLAWSCLSSAWAHKPSDSYLSLEVKDNQIAGQWDIALRDLEFAIGLDADADGAITWGELKAKHAEIAAFAMARLQLSTENKRCGLKVTEHMVADHTDGAYAVLRFNAECAQALQTLQANYSLFFDIDPQHKGLLRLQYAGSSHSAIFSPEKATQEFKLQQPDKFSQFVDYCREGVWHIWIGFDHILFLIALLLPAVVLRQEKKWQAVAAFRPAFFDVFKIVTAFTVAHSITLTLATLNIVTLPSRLVESVIAASVVFAAINNIKPLFRERRWLMAFVFGLIHGFGFASVLSDLGLPSGTLGLALFGFNLGVELGQLAIVAVFLPLAYALRGTWFYRYLVLIGGSIVIAALAAVWFAERAFDLKLLVL